MLRGAEILFSAIFAVTFLKRSLNKRHYIGIAFCLVGISMVGASSLLKPTEGGSSDAGKVLLGMVLIVVAQARQHSSYSFFTLFVTVSYPGSLDLIVFLLLWHREEHQH
jgi:drug/metabolite transporter (DMT)-like permease